MRNGLISLASASASFFDSNIYLWDFSKDFTLVETIKGHSGTCSTICQLRNRVIVWGSYDYTIKLWDNNYECIATLNEHNDYIMI